MAKFEVLFSGMTDAAGNFRGRGELVDESEIADLPGKLAMGALKAVEGDTKPEGADAKSETKPEGDTKPEGAGAKSKTK